MPHSDKHLISNSSALSESISRVSGPRQSHSWSAGCLGEHGAPASTKQQGCEKLICLFFFFFSLGLPQTRVGHSIKQNGFDGITDWGNAVLLISTFNDCCRNWFGCHRSTFLVPRTETSSSAQDSVSETAIWTRLLEKPANHTCCMRNYQMYKCLCNTKIGKRKLSFLIFRNESLNSQLIPERHFLSKV